MDPITPYITAPTILDDPFYDKPLFQRKLSEIGHLDEFAEEVMISLYEKFTMLELKAAIQEVKGARRLRMLDDTGVDKHPMLALAEANYQIVFASETPISERVIFPNSPSEANGLEDARWV